MHTLKLTNNQNIIIQLQKYNGNEISHLACSLMLRKTKRERRRGALEGDSGLHQNIVKEFGDNCN